MDETASARTGGGRREIAADAIGLGLMLLVLLDYVRLDLVFLPTIAAGGDTPCHYPTLAWFHEHLLPHFRFQGWYPGAYLGHPLLLYYFPLPFLVMSALAPLTGLPVAFKLGSLLGVFLLPPLTYVSFRLMGFRFPAPLLGTAAGFVFLFLEENPIWGGTLASTLTGEFSYAYGIALAVLFLGITYRAIAEGRGPWGPALALAITGLAHGYAVLWAGLAASFFLYGARRPWRMLARLAQVAALAFALIGFFILPLLSDWGWTTPYDDPWITVTAKNLFPPLLWPLFLFALAGLATDALLARQRGGMDRRLLFLAHAGVMGAALAMAGPALGIIDIRFVPFAQLAACLVGGAALGLALRMLAAPDMAALGFVILALLHADSRSQVIRYWVEWDESGLEAKERWPEFKRLTQALKGTVADTRVAVEYSQEHEKAGSIRMYETLPYFTGRSTLEGVYNQASVQTHPVYFVASELGASSPNPFRKRDYSSFDTDNALRHLRLFATSDIVALSPKLVGALSARTDVEQITRIPPYTLFRLKDPPRGYVEPMAFVPIRTPIHDWREKAYRWFTRKPLSPVHLVFSDDAERFKNAEWDEWLEPQALPLPGGVSVQETVEDESISITTSRVGHPLLVKVSYHPRWRVDGADGPYLVSPALMMVVPTRTNVRLYYARTAADQLGLALTAGALGFAAWSLRKRQQPAVKSAPHPGLILTGLCDPPKGPRRWGGAIPTTLVVVMCLSRAVVWLRAGEKPDPQPLYEKASRAYAAEQFGDAAEYARHAIKRSAGAPLRAELLCLRGESLLRTGRGREAVDAFDTLVRELPASPHMAQALYGSLRAHQALGEADAARLAGERLAHEHANTPWAARAAAEAPGVK